MGALNFAPCKKPKGVEAKMLSRDRKERSADTVKQLVDQATASTPTEDDYRQIQLQIMIKHLEDSKKLEEEKNHQLVRHLEDVLKANQNMISEKEALIAQNIADVRKLQEDTICWKDRYEELAAKLELLDKRLDPRLIEAQDTIATLKRTIALLQQEKSHSKRESSRSHQRRSLNENFVYEENWIENFLKEVKSNFKNPVKVKVYKVTPGEGPSSKSTADNSQTDSKISISIEELVSPTYPSGNSEVISTSSGRRRSEATNYPAETSVAKTKGENKVSAKHRTSIRSGSKRLTRELEKLPTPKVPQRGSISRLSPSDLSVVSDGLRRSPSSTQSTQSKAENQLRGENRSSDLAHCKEGGVFYLSPSRKCKVVCEDVPQSSSIVEGVPPDEVVARKPINADVIEGSQQMPTQIQFVDEPNLEERKAPKKEMVKIVLPPGNSRINAGDKGNTFENDEEMVRQEKSHSRNALPDKATKVDSNVAKDDYLAELLEYKRSTKRRSALPHGKLTFDYPDSNATKETQNDDIISSCQDISLLEQMAPASHAEFHPADLEIYSRPTDESVCDEPTRNLEAVESPEESHYVPINQGHSNEQVNKESQHSLPQSSSEVEESQSSAKETSQSVLTDRRQAVLLQEIVLEEESRRRSSLPDKVAEVDNNETKNDYLAEYKRVSISHSLTNGTQSSHPIEESQNDSPSFQELSPAEQTASTPYAEFQPVSLDKIEPSPIIDENSREGIEPLQKSQVTSNWSLKGSELSNGQRNGESKLSQLKSSSGHLRTQSSAKTSQAALTHEQEAFVGSRDSIHNDGSDITVPTASCVSVGSAGISSKILPAEQIPGNSSASVKTTGDDRAMLFLLTARKDDPADDEGIEVSGVSMLAKDAIAVDSTPFTIPSRGSASNSKTVIQQVPSKRDVKDLQQFRIVTQPQEILPEASRITSLLSVGDGSKESSSIKKLPSPSKGILKDQAIKSSSSGLKLNSKPAEDLKASSEVASHYYSTLDKSKMDVIENKTVSLPSVKGISTDPRVQKSTTALAADISVINDPTDKILLVVSETGKSNGIELAPSSRNVIQSANSIVESVTGSTSSEISSKIMPPSDRIALENVTASNEALLNGSRKGFLSIVGSTHYTRSEESGGSKQQRGVSEGSDHARQSEGSHHSVHSGSNEPVQQKGTSESDMVPTSGDALNTDLTPEQDPQPPSGSGVLSEPSRIESVSFSHSNDPSLEKLQSLQQQQHSESISLKSGEDSSRVSTIQPSSAVSSYSVSRSWSEPEQHGRLTFGDAEKISFVLNTAEATSSQISPPNHERFKILERTSITKLNLPPIEEEVESADSAKKPSPSPSSIVQQRRQSMVTPGLLKRKSRPSTFSSAVSTASTFVDDESESSVSEYSHRASAFDRCPCKKMCECCICSQKTCDKPSFLSRLSRASSKDRPLSMVDARIKSTSKPQLPRIGAIDLSSPPVPKNSLEVLHSPFYAHWDYYDLDQDHPIARFIRRPDHAEFENTDTILMKNVRVGGYTIPYLKLQTKEKVSSKIVCNFYKSRKMPIHRKGNSEGIVVDSTDNMDEKISSSLLGKEGSKEKMKCQCKNAKEEEENIWKNYPRDDGADLLGFPSDNLLDQSKCTMKSEGGCKCVEQPESARAIPMPATPCESCDCFISDVELEAAPQLPVRRSGLIDSSDSEVFSVDRTAVVNEYICSLQELCANLCAMIGKMRLVIDDTSISGSTFRSPRASPVKPALGSPRESADQAEKKVGKR